MRCSASPAPRHRCPILSNNVNELRSVGTQHPVERRKIGGVLSPEKGGVSTVVIPRPKLTEKERPDERT